MQKTPSHILITGASSGIGAALALAYAAPDVRLSLHGRSVERLAAVAEEVQRKGALVATTIGDVTDMAAMAEWIAGADRQQPIDLAIANAGVSGGTSGVAGDRNQIDKIFAVNLGGVLNTIHPAIDAMLKRKAGQVAIMSSLAGLRGFAGSGAYCASKAAVRVYGEALRADLAPQGIKVNVICPGWVETPMTDINPFPMPFRMNAERAAQIISKGLAENRARIAFPWQMYALVRVFALLPEDWGNRLAGDRFRKPPFDG